MKRIETGSSLGTFRTCPKKYSLAYEERLESPRYNQNLGYGNFVHAYRAIHHAQTISQIEMTKAVQDGADLYESLMHKYADAHDQINADNALAKRMVELWWDYWNLDGSHLGEEALEWRDVEWEWEFPVQANPEFVHAGKSDGYVRQKEWDKFFLYELKTASDRGGDSYLHRLQLDHQINSNLIALQRAGRPFAGVIYDVIWKPALRRLTGRKTKPDETLEEFNGRIIAEVQSNPSEYFTRVCVNRTAEHLRLYEDELHAQFKASEPFELKYRNPSACMNFNTLCQYFDVCMDPHAAEMRNVFKRRPKKHPELKGGEVDVAHEQAREDRDNYWGSGS